MVLKEGFSEGGNPLPRRQTRGSLPLKDLVHAPGPITLEVEGHVGKACLLETLYNPLPEALVVETPYLRRTDPYPSGTDIKPSPELGKPEAPEKLPAPRDPVEPVLRYLGAVGEPRGEARERRFVP